VTLIKLDIMPSFEVGKPALTKFRWREVAIGRYLRPDCLRFLNKEVASNVAALALNLLLPAKEDCFEDRPMRLRTTEVCGS